jgi:hypothetical protein
MTSQIITAGQISASIAAILTLAGIGIKWGILKPLKLYIREMTREIQPNANGGNSLPDAIKAIQKVDNKLNSMDKRVQKLEKAICTLD